MKYHQRPQTRAGRAEQAKIIMFQDLALLRNYIRATKPVGRDEKFVAKARADYEALREIAMKKYGDTNEPLVGDVHFISKKDRL